MTESEQRLREFTERYARNIDEADQLRRKRVVVLGPGAVGGFVAWELANHGCSLDLIDRDVVDSSNQARHVLGARKYLGKPKASALAAHLRHELPRLQQFHSLVADITRLTREQLAERLAGADLIIAATGRDEIDRVLDQWARHLGIPILFPSMWAGEHPVLGDLLVVAWNVEGRRGGCFSCLRPQREEAGPPADAQPGLRSDVQRVANLTAETALALLLSESPQHAPLTAQLQRGITYFLVPRWPPTVRTVLTRRRRGCSVCSPTRSLGVSITREVNTPDATRLRNWIITLTLASATLWHQAVPGFDALASMAFITVVGLWWRNRLPSLAVTSAWIRRQLFGQA